MAAKPPETGKRAGWWRRSRAVAAAAKPKARPLRTRLGFSASYSKGDIALFAAGIAVSGVCAMFPWYVFVNQDQFNPPSVKLGNIPSSGRPPRDWRPVERIGEEETTEANLENTLDTFTTGTTALREQMKSEIEEAEEQPFPLAPPPEYELVHVANGRAMIQDDKGLYVVQRGSLLPDNSLVARIEKRDGRWILVTSNDRVLEVAQ